MLGEQLCPTDLVKVAQKILGRAVNRGRRRCPTEGKKEASDSLNTPFTPKS